MQTIEVGIDGMVFHARHGVFPEENQLGAKYEVDVRFTLDAPARSDTISETVDYGAVFELVQQVMQVPRKLLETLSAELAQRLLSEYPKVTKVQVRVIKHHPPVGGLAARAWVTHTEERP